MGQVTLQDCDTEMNQSARKKSLLISVTLEDPLFTMGNMMQKNCFPMDCCC